MKGFVLFSIGLALGYCLVQGIALVNQNFLWTLFYQG